LADAFRYEQGQHVTVRADIGGQDLRRSYSICSAVQDASLRIAVKRNPQGVFSTWANEALQAGDHLDVMPPMGHFNVPLAPETASITSASRPAAASRHCYPSSRRRSPRSRARSSRSSTAIARPAP